MDPWIFMPPQVPHQNWVKCFGTVRINDISYIMSDVVKDIKTPPKKMERSESIMIKEERLKILAGVSHLG